MTFSTIPSFASTPTQRNRRLLLVLPGCALPILSACGGGGDLSYDTEQALYIVGEAITPNNPTLSGGKPNAPSGATATFSVKPALPTGLTLNTSTGVISGIPTKLKRQAIHVVTATTTARRVRESAETQLRITVTGRGAWKPVATVAAPRYRTVIAPLPGGKFLVAGGRTNTEGSTNSVEIYDPVAPAWNPAAPMLQARLGSSAVMLQSGRVLVFGGDADSPEPGLAEIYNPADNTWTATTGRLNETRSFSTAHLLASGKVLAVGGIGDNSGGTAFRDTAELYDPGTGVWTLLPTRLSAPRSAGLAGALLPDGKTLLVVGGNGVTTAELYKVDGTSTQVIPYGVGALEHRAVKLDDGSVLVTSDGSNLSRRFNPGTSSWTTSPMVNGPRAATTVTVLADGRVLVSGGLDASQDVALSLSLNTAEIYNPDVNRWTAAAPMAAARSVAVAALLGDGSVLVVSGFTSATESGFVNASERYIP